MLEHFLNVSEKKEKENGFLEIELTRSKKHRVLYQLLSPD
jgi:hypothetical protein